MMRRLAVFLVLCVGLYFGLNYAWTRAALAGLSDPDSSCPSSMIDQANERVEAFFGHRMASPRFICLDEPRLGLSVSHGSTYFAPLLPSLVVLGPRGRDTDVAAHEAAHAEIAARTSALLRTYRMPTWFDEGLAMQLDHRADYDSKALARHVGAGRLTAETLSGIATPSAFFQNGEQGKAHYALARCVVGNWLKKAGKRGALQALDNVSWTKDFDTRQIQSHSAACLKAHQAGL